MTASTFPAPHPGDRLSHDADGGRIPDFASTEQAVTTASDLARFAAASRCPDPRAFLPVVSSMVRERLDGKDMPWRAMVGG